RSSLSDSIGIVRMLLRRLGLPRALCERGYRPSGRGHRRQRPAPSSGRHRGCRNPTRSRLGQSERNARAQRAELAAPPLLSFLHLARNSAYATPAYSPSGSRTFRTSPMCYAVARPRRKLCRFAVATDGTDDTLCLLFWHGRHSTAHLSKEMCCVSSCVCAVALTCGMRLLRGLGQRLPALARGGPRHRLPGPRGCLSRRPAPPRAGTRPVWP